MSYFLSELYSLYQIWLIICLRLQSYGSELTLVGAYRSLHIPMAADLAFRTLMVAALAFRNLEATDLAACHIHMVAHRMPVVGQQQPLAVDRNPVAFRNLVVAGQAYRILASTQGQKPVAFHHSLHASAVARCQMVELQLQFGPC